MEDSGGEEKRRISLWNGSKGGVESFKGHLWISGEKDLGEISCRYGKKGKKGKRGEGLGREGKRKRGQ